MSVLFLGVFLSMLASRASPQAAYRVYLNVRRPGHVPMLARHKCQLLRVSLKSLSVCLSVFFQAVGVLSHQQQLCGFRMSKGKGHYAKQEGTFKENVKDIFRMNSVIGPST